MSAHDVLTILAFLAVILALSGPVGRWLHAVLEGARPPGERLLGGLERACYRLAGLDPDHEQTWDEYASSMLVFSGLGALLTYGLLRTQGVLPLNPQHLTAPPAHLALVTAISFATNTNWQSYAGETTMSYLSQMLALTVQNFLSTAVGMAVAVALARGMTRGDRAGTLGSFWRDLVRSVVYVLLPACLLYAIFLVSCGVVQNLSPYLTLRTLDGGAQTLPMGPIASQEAIKIFGTNGGGFLNANSAHPFENPSALSDWSQMVAILVLPAGLVRMYGRMAGRPREGLAILGAMAGLFLVGALFVASQEASWGGGLGNWEGKETRFGLLASALYAATTTAASCGAVNAMHDSFTALGGLVPLVNIQLGEVVFGGVGAGLYGVLVMAVLTVFLAGLMVGRTPELLGKKIEVREMQLATLYALIFPALILGFSGLAAVSGWGLDARHNPGPHGLSEILYAFSSAAGNNGSAFAGLDTSTPPWSAALSLAMFFGRYGMIVPALAIGGSLAKKQRLPPGPGTFPTDGPLFAALLAAVIVIVGALTFLPALALGPLADQVSP